MVRECAAAAASTVAGGETESRLVVKEPGELNLLGRFMRALLLSLLKDPERMRVAERMDLKVAIEPPGHPENALTLSFSGGRVILENGAAPEADIRIVSEVAMLIRLARMPAGPAALRFLFTHEGRSLLAALRAGELRLKGVMRHPLGMMRFSSFMGPKPGSGVGAAECVRHSGR